MIAIANEVNDVLNIGGFIVKNGKDKVNHINSMVEHVNNNSIANLYRRLKYSTRSITGPSARPPMQYAAVDDAPNTAHCFVVKIVLGMIVSKLPLHTLYIPPTAPPTIASHTNSGICIAFFVSCQNRYGDVSLLSNLNCFSLESEDGDGGVGGLLGKYAMTNNNTTITIPK